MAPNSPKIIMVVDDDRFIRAFVQDRITSMGHRVYSAADGSEALKMVRDLGLEVNLLISDVLMPGMNGLELAKMMLAAAPDAKIIFMSGCVQPALISANSAKYKGGFIRKPFSGKTLVDHVKKAVDELHQDTVTQTW